MSGGPNPAHGYNAGDQRLRSVVDDATLETALSNFSSLHVACRHHYR